MAIKKLTEFAVNGEKNIDGLTEVEGFPVLEKPARQWFNYLFNKQSVKTNELVESVNSINSSIIGIVNGTDIQLEKQYEKQTLRSLSEKFSDLVSVKDFGAVGDGVSDDSTYFQNAINALQGTNRILFIPDGTYPISGIDLKGVSLYSNGCKILTNGDTTNRYLIKDSTTNPIRIFNITFDGIGAVQDATSVWQRCILFEQNDSVITRDVSYINCKGSLVEFKNGVKTYSITGGRVIGCTDANGFIVRAKHGIINSVLFRDCTEHVIRFGRFNNDADVESGKYNTVSSCSFFNIGNDAILFEINSSHGIVANCTANNVRSLVKCEADSVITESQRAYRVTVSNNICIAAIGVTSAAIKTNSAKNCIITGNTVDGFFDGISAGDNSIVTGNTLLNITNQAIRTRGNDLNITDNYIKTAKVGILASDFTGSSIKNNRIDLCETGVACVSANNFISGNIVKNCGIGIRLYNSATNTLVIMNKGEGNTTPVSNVAPSPEIKMNFGDFSNANVP